LRYGDYCFIATMTGEGAAADEEGFDGAVDAAMTASRALVGIAARSLAVLDGEITLAQFRALVLVADGRVSTPGDLAAALDVHPSNATRVVDRMVEKDLLVRSEAKGDRRGVSLAIGRAGRAALRDVMTRRRSEMRAVLARLPPDRVDEVADALGGFADAAGESAEEAWRLGWAT
jgi:DNA-binding MarR family transcriptional regulator